ncbi:[acyl-carrier-protein] S-malonyltransferase [Paenibacillus polymyxa]|uniref:ACP S-malonyltransferase n=1 Tax=Paenibacillus polymyxa TaxID=1406 RepID=UPI00278E5FFF|nr:ACP S-malonyltransferase [Paenibacillus polymyxa]MDQ0050711.1 [acyl-carrier-protein] S-malonyltransferase [Paenibacillus polymyxa]
MSSMTLLFSGQGSQYVGMGAAWQDGFSETDHIFEEAADILGYDLKTLCMEGPISQLSRTSYTQPALLTISVIAFRRYMHDVGIIPQFSAGHSLGEYSALVSSGVLSFGDALRVVQERGRFMEEASEAGVGCMIAVRGADLNLLEELCDHYAVTSEPVTIACYNSSYQYVVSGHHASVAAVAGQLEQRGFQITRLQVSGPFHSPLMQHAANRLALELQKYTFHEPLWPVISNVTALPYTDANSIRQGLHLQMIRPVRWIQTMQYMEKYGVKQGIELGPRTVLKNLAKETNIAFEVLSLDRDLDRIELERRFSLRDWLVKPLTVAVSTPNANWNEDEYHKGVILPIRRLEELLKSIESDSSSSAYELRREALECIRLILQTKQVSAGEHEEVLDLLRRDQDGAVSNFN